MAWGDLRYDHSDIFTDEVRIPARETKGADKKLIGCERRKAIIELLMQFRELTRCQIRRKLGIAKENGSLNALLKRLVRDGRIVAEKGMMDGSTIVYRLPERRLVLR